MRAALVAMFLAAWATDAARAADTRTGRAAYEALRDAVTPCLVAPPNARGRVVARFRLRRDGTLAGPPVVTGNTAHGGDAAALRELIRSVNRAVVRCAPHDMGAIGPALGAGREVELRYVQGDAVRDTPAAMVDTFGVSGAAVRLPRPAGLCRVAPERGEAERHVFQSMAAASQRRGETGTLVALHVNCEARPSRRTASAPRDVLITFVRAARGADPVGSTVDTVLRARRNNAHTLPVDVMNGVATAADMPFETVGATGVGRKGNVTCLVTGGAQPGAGVLRLAKLEGADLLLSAVGFTATTETQPAVRFGAEVVRLARVAAQQSTTAVPAPSTGDAAD